MRLLIVSDIHANWAALGAIPADADAVVFLGDAVSYGPLPAECVAWIRRNATVAVRGNHDHAIAFGEDPRCSPAFRNMATATLAWHTTLLTDEDKAYLGSLPLTASFEFAGATFFAVHGSPRDPLYRYVHGDPLEAVLLQELEGISADVVLMGHTHLPYARRLSRGLVLNPGSVGQPKHGRPTACYATWDDGAVELHQIEYSVEAAVRRLEAAPLPAKEMQELIGVLRTGRI
ncbi:MAG: metallophosphoesterase family protein [Chthonomonadales bacterium]